MSKQAKHPAKHRGAPRKHVAVEAPRKALRNTLIVSSVAVTATGVTVGGGLLGASPAATATAATDVPVTTNVDAFTAGLPTVSEVRRTPVLSRSSDRRQVSDPAKEAALSATGGPAVAGAENLAASAPTDIARSLLGQYGWDQSQFGCLYDLWQRESGWNPHAANPSSSAYGIPQALPGSKMASAGADWEDNPVTQITWGLGYIQDRYGSPCGAWGHSQSNGWY